MDTLDSVAAEKRAAAEGVNLSGARDSGGGVPEGTRHAYLGST